MDLYAVNGSLLYSTRSSSLKGTLAQAIQDGVALPEINLRRARLRHARLDGLQMAGGCLWGADLTGSDISGADLSGVDARMTTFADACLADTDCTGSRFEGAYFRQTLLDGTNFEGCTFSCPSFLQQSLHLCVSLKRAVYWHRGEEACPLEEGVTRLMASGHTIVWIGKRLLVNGILLEARGLHHTGKDESHIKGKKNAICADL